jgi:hypothetical protein
MNDFGGIAKPLSANFLDLWVPGRIFPKIWGAKEEIKPMAGWPPVQTNTAACEPPF